MLAGIGAVVLLGWATDVEVLKRVIPGLVTMNPVTAVLFLSCGTSLFFSACGESPPKWKNRARAACGALAAAVGLWTCLTYLFGYNAVVDQLLFASKLNDAQPGIVSKMAPNTAFCFLLGGISLCVLDWNARSRWHPSELLSLVMGMVALLAMTGYLLNATSFYRVTAYIPMALHAAFGFLVLSMGIVMARPERGFIRLLRSPGAGGVTMRRLLPAALVVPVVLELMRMEGERARFFDGAFGISLMVVATMVCFAALISFNAIAMERAEEARRLAEEEIRLLNAKLKLHSDQLESANQELEAFSYSVSHDLRAPLRAVDGFSNILLNEYSGQISSDGQRLVNIIVGSTRKMGRLIDDLLRLSKMGRASLEKQEVWIAGMVEEIVADLRQQHDGRAIVVRLGELPNSQADPSLLRQVLVNLLSNAFKFTRDRDPAVIEIGCRCADKEKIYFVRDNGAGFDMKAASKLFGVFQRVHSEEQFEGTGVGLSIVQRIIKRHGGRIWVEAEPEKGATFYFSLPDS